MKNYLYLVIFLLPVMSFAQQIWTLEQCIEHAKLHNIDILKQQLQNTKADKDIDIAKGNYLPDANFSASQGYSLGNSFDVSTGVGQLESRFNNFSLSSSVNIFNGFSNKYELQYANINAQKGFADLDKLGLDLSLNIANKYLQVLFNKEILTVAKEQFVISEQEVERLTKLFRAALKSKSELLQMESTLAIDSKEVAIAQNNLSNSLIELKEMLDINTITDFDVEVLNVELIENDYVFSTSGETYQKALQNNPLLKSSQLSLDLSEKKIQIAKARFYPSVRFNYSYGSNYYHIQGRDDLVFNQTTQQFEDNGFWTQLNNNKTHYLGFSALVPIFNKFLTKSNTEKAKVDLEISQLEVESQKQILKNKIDIAYNNVLTAKTALEASKTALNSQKEVFNIDQKKYRDGYITSYEFLESKSKHIQVQSDLIKAKYDYIFKIKVLDYYKD